ncbi:PepSY domain-containing protein [Pedobacter frigiditerrae]|uniref:PepSY domain-containing protein n=1 Tax=Pedobacter frigiditerrae TaxID=2530452 RepID=A0A4R0MW56_9SPHI|nr:PepSY-associated TM helix domain-containing protein [Pedobacter frigiditerrae]TCC90154.1 PepSY domain-containing protein [Pedobacter frigiditerrae]
MTLKKLIAQIHLWLGLTSGLVVVILGISGAIYTFSDEIKDIVYKDRRYVSVVPKNEKLSLDTLLSIAKQSLGETHKITRAELSQDPERTYMFRAFKINKKSSGYWNYYDYYLKVYLDPYTGKVVFKEDASKEFFTVVLALHMNLLLGDGLGHFIVKWSTVCFGILLLSGLVLWWPKKWKQKQLKKNFAIKWNGKFKRLNYDLHNVLGFYMLIPLLVIALTGLAWSFELTTDKKSKVLSDTTQTTKASANQILKQSLEKSPKTAYFLYNFPAAKSGTVNISAYQSKEHLYDRRQYRFDQYTGKLLMEADPMAAAGITPKLIALNYDLHTGSALGMFGKILAFLASLIAAGLPITGFIIWIKKGKKSEKTKIIAGNLIKLS